MRQYISDPGVLLDEVWRDKDVNIIEKQHKLGRSKFCLFDISVNAYGQEEDKKYICSPFYRANIRRGNTIIEDLSRRDKIDWARKGTPKILDIKLQYLRFFLKKLQLKKQERVVAEIIFEGVNQAFSQGKRVQLIKTQKVNGQNAQVSYNYDFDAWVICSKNVSLLASSLRDLDLYSDNRYKYAVHIAQQWFREISHLNKDQINALKKKLDGYTIIGQYCGNPKFQHLIRYEQISIIWFAMVDNYSDEYCIDPFKTKKQLSSFKLKTAQIKNILISSNPDQFYTSLEELYLKTAQAGLQDEEFGMQGSIVYFAVQEMKDKSSVRAVTVGAGKLKTLQYRYFRKIREKLSRYIVRKQSSGDLVKKFVKEIRELQDANESKAIFPQEYYVKILRGGFQLVENSAIRDEQLRGKFINLLKIIFYALHKKISLKKHGKIMLKDSNFIEKISEIPFTKYGGLGCSTKIIYIVLGLPGMFKSYLGNLIAPHFDKIGIPYKILEFQSEDSFKKNMNELCNSNKEINSLQHYYLDGSFDSTEILKIIQGVRKNGNKNSYYKMIVIEDQCKQKEVFECDDRNQYPFRLETILMSYLGQHEKKKNCLTIQQKIDNLKIVTQKLKKNANFNVCLEKSNIAVYNYPFSQKCKIQSLEEFSSIIKTILATEDEKILYNQYCILIIRLQKIKGIQYMSEQSANNEIKHLIQSSYPFIPMICFKNS